MGISKKPDAVISVVSILILTMLVGFVIGPSRLARWWDAEVASGYGADWIVVQYAQDGSVINTWELKATSVGSEDGSDGIYFTDSDGNVVHLSGHYVYVQVKNNRWEGARKRFLR